MQTIEETVSFAACLFLPRSTDFHISGYFHHSFSDPVDYIISHSISHINPREYKHYKINPTQSSNALKMLH